jgi:hypothetical protein
MMRAETGITYQGAHVRWTDGNGLVHVGEVVARNTTADADVFILRYFCGDDAGDVPVAYAEILEREYESA